MYSYLLSKKCYCHNMITIDKKEKNNDYNEYTIINNT